MLLDSKERYQLGSTNSYLFTTKPLKDVSRNECHLGSPQAKLKSQRDPCSRESKYNSPSETISISSNKGCSNN